MPAVSDDIPLINVSELADALRDGAVLIDVREPDEFAEARAPGARLIPLMSVPERIDECRSANAVYVICKSGGRSAKAVDFLRSEGIDAVNVAGGTLAWLAAGLPHESGPPQ